MTLYTFFPVFNEQEACANLARRITDYCTLRGYDYHILAVNDGSTDNSQAYLEETATSCNIDIIKHNTNQGLREALKTGLSWLRERISDEDVIIFMDGDDTHDPSHYVSMLEQLALGSDVVIASRYRKGARIFGLSRFRQFLSLGSAFLGFILFKIKGVRDYTCGFRAVRGKTLNALFKRYEGNLFSIPGQTFVCQIEWLLKLATVTDRFSEVPLILQYNRKKTPSKMRTIPMIVAFFSLWWRKNQLLIK